MKKVSDSFSRGPERNLQKRQNLQAQPSGIAKSNDLVERKGKPKKRTYNPRRVRTGQSYSVQEIAELYGLHKNAVLRWIKDGLPLIDQRKPFMIHGGDLAEYLTNKQSGRKHKCKPDEFFCFKCRAPRRAWENAPDIIIRNESKLTISGLCAVCDTPVHRVGTVKKLPEYQKIFLIQKIHERHITDTSDPSVNSDMRKDEKHGQVQPEK